MPSSHPETNYSRFFGRRRSLAAGGGGRAGSVLVSTDAPGPPSQGAVSGTGQALQGDTLPDPAGRVGGEGIGDSTPGGVLHFLGRRVGKALNLHHFLYICFKMPIFKGFSG
jgi:hypothetical protein